MAISLKDADVERFWNRVDRRGDDECWPWRAGRHSAGYGAFSVLVDGVRRTRPAHQVAAHIAFGPSNGRFTLHSCDNRPCCNPKHLRYGSQRDNVHDALARQRHIPPPTHRGDDHPFRRGFAPKGEEKVNTQLTDEVAQAVWRLHMAGKNATEVAELIGLTVSIVADLVRGRTFKHLHGVDGAPTFEQIRSGGVRRNKLSAEQIAEVMRLIDAGRSNKDIAARFGVSTTPISNLRTRGRTW